MSLPAYALDDESLLATCERTRSATGGPGGQHAARRATAVRLVHRPTGVSAACGDHRDGAANLREALRRLRLALAVTLRGGADPAWVAAHRRGTHLAVGPKAGGFHLVVAVLLDALAAAEGRLKDAAVACGISTSQLTRVLCAEAPVRAAADAIRAEHGCSPLRP